MYLQIIKIAEIAVSAMLIIAVLLQTKGGGLSAVFGGEGNVYTVRRGGEKGGPRRLCLDFAARPGFQVRLFIAFGKNDGAL